MVYFFQLYFYPRLLDIKPKFIQVIVPGHRVPTQFVL